MSAFLERLTAFLFGWPFLILLIWEIIHSFVKQ